jgi:hypothetical protein
MGAPGPGELHEDGERGPPEAALAGARATAEAADTEPPPPPVYRLGSADIRPQPVARFPRLVLLIVLGVVVVSALTFEVVQWRTQRALRTATATANREAEQVAEQLSREQQTAIEREAAKQQQLQAQDDARRRELAQRQQAEEAAVDDSRAREQARESAWLAFYRPAPGCKDSTSVQCANAYIKARREFDRQYAAGTTAASTPAR